MNSTKTRTTFWIATDMISDTCVNGTLTESFHTYDEAVKYWETECRDRNKGDEYDKKWNNWPCIIIGRTMTETIFN